MSQSNTTPPSGNNTNAGALKNTSNTQAKNPNAWNKKTGTWNKPGENSKKKFEKFQGATKGLEDHTFYYGQGMDTKFVTSKEHILNYIGKKYSSSEEVSLEKGKVVLLGHTQPTKYNDRAAFEKLPFWEQEQWKIDMKRYTEMKATLNKNLTACYAIIWGQMNDTLQNHVKRDPSYAAIDATRNGPELLTLVSNVCNKTSNIDHFMTRSTDALYAITQLSGTKMSLGDYYKHFVSKRKTAEITGLNFGSSKQQDGILETVKSKYGWNTNDADYQAFEKDKKTHANEQFFAMIFLKQAGERYEQVRTDLKNDYAKAKDNIPLTVDDMYSLLQIYKVPRAPKQNGNQRGNSKKSGGSADVNEETNNNTKAKHGVSFQQKDFS